MIKKPVHALACWLAAMCTIACAVFVCSLTATPAYADGYGGRCTINNLDGTWACYEWNFQLVINGQTLPAYCTSGINGDHSYRAPLTGDATWYYTASSSGSNAGDFNPSFNVGNYSTVKAAYNKERNMFIAGPFKADGATDISLDGITSGISVVDAIGNAIAPSIGQDFYLQFTPDYVASKSLASDNTSFTVHTGENIQSWWNYSGIYAVSDQGDMSSGFQVIGTDSPLGGSGSEYKVQDFSFNISFDPIIINIQKFDSETGSTAQGKSALTGAVYTITNNSTGQSWNANIPSNPAFPDYWSSAALGLTFPFGVYTIKETTAPVGYNLSKESYTLDATTPGDNGTTVSFRQDVKDDVIRGNMTLVKNANQANDDGTFTGDNNAMKNVVFSITSKTNGSVVYVLTDENGFAMTSEGYYTNVVKDASGQITGVDPTSYQEANSRGALVFDDYTLHECNCPTGYMPVADHDFTIDQQGKNVKFDLIDGVIVSYPQIFKTDAETQKVVAEAGTKFQILDADKDPIQMTVTYPSVQTLSEFTTDETGQVTLPQALVSGTYYVKETQAPNGYVLNNELVKFDVDEYHAITNLQELKFSDMPQKGSITINKTDADTKAPLSGALFGVYAAEDIVTPDGTVRATKDSLVDTVTTDAAGHAITKNLYLGKYYLKEMQRLTLSQNADPTGILTNTTTYINGSTGGNTIVGKEITFDADKLLKYVTTNVNQGATQADVRAYLSKLGAYSVKYNATSTYSYVADFATSVYSTLSSGLLDTAKSVSDWSFATTPTTTSSRAVPALTSVNNASVSENQKVSSDDTLTYTYSGTMENSAESYLYNCTWTDGSGNNYSIDRTKKQIICSNGNTVQFDNVVIDAANSTATFTSEDGTTYILSWSATDTIDGYVATYNVKFVNKGKAAGDPTSQTLLTLSTASKPDWKIVFTNVYAPTVSYIADSGTLTVNGTNKPITVSNDTTTNTLVATSTENVPTGAQYSITYKLKVNDSGIKDMHILNPITYSQYAYQNNDSEYPAELTYAGQNTAITTTSADITNTANTLTVKKTDLTTGKEIPGATLRVKDAAGNDVDTWISTSEDHVIKGIAPGVYTLSEVLAPSASGYVKASNISFTVKADGSVNMVEMKDDYTKLDISKADITDGHELAGAQLTITDNTTGAEIASWTTDGTAKRISYIAPGTYTLTENAAPDGYQIADAQKFTVASTGEIQKCVMYDAPNDYNVADERIDNGVLSDQYISKTGDMDIIEIAILSLIAAGAGIGIVRTRRKMSV